MRLGQHGIYRVPENHFTTTKKGSDVEHEGSIYHHQMREFHCTVGRVRETEDGERADLALLVPGKSEHVWVHGVAEDVFEPAIAAAIDDADED